VVAVVDRWWMARVSRVVLYEQIRRAAEREELSIRELSRRFGVHRRDVRQALASPVPPARRRPGRPSPLLTGGSR
jgi:ActR/RegA family two-component response regulator